MSQTQEPQSRTDQVSEVYAGALLELSDQHQITQAMAEELASLLALWQDQPSLRQLMESRVISRDHRTGMIERLFKGKVSDTLYRFIQVLNHKRRLEALPRICVAFANRIAQRNGQVAVDLYTASTMTDDQLEPVRAAVSTAFGGGEVTLRQHQDPSLIGGLKLRVGDQLIDASVATQLKLMKQKLVAVGRDKARAAAAGL